MARFTAPLQLPPSVLHCVVHRVLHLWCPPPILTGHWRVMHLKEDNRWKQCNMPPHNLTLLQNGRDQVHDVHREQRTKHHHAHNVSVIYLRWSLCWKWEVVVKSAYSWLLNCVIPSHTPFTVKEKCRFYELDPLLLSLLLSPWQLLSWWQVPHRNKLHSQHVRCGLTRVIRVQHRCCHEAVHTATMHH